MSAYVTAKLYVAWWAAALSRKLPAGLTVNAVSPGSVPTTGFLRNQPMIVRLIMSSVMPLMGRFMGMAGPISVAARRYVDAANFDDTTTGQFFGSPSGKLVGELQVQHDAHFSDEEMQTSCWHVIVRLSGGIDYPAA